MNLTFFNYHTAVLNFTLSLSYSKFHIIHFINFL